MRANQAPGRVRRSWFARAAVPLVMALMTPLLVAVPATAAALPAVAPADVLPDSQWDVTQWERQMMARDRAQRLPSSTLAGGGPSTYPVTRIAGARAAAKRAATDAAAGKVTVPTHGTTLGKVGAAGVKGANVAGVVAFGLGLGYEAGGVVGADLFGLQSNGLACDIEALIGPGTCSITAAQDYAPNSDYLVMEPGWTNGNVVRYSNPLTGASGTFKIEDVTSTWTATPDGKRRQLNVLMRIYVMPEHCVPRSGAGILFRAVPEQWTGGTATSATPAYNPVSGQDYGGVCPDPGTGLLPQRIMTLATSSSVDVTQYRLDFGGYRGAWAEGGAGGWIDPNNMAGFDTSWYPEGHPDRPTGMEANITRQWRTTWTCKYPNGAETVSELGAEFRESDETWPEWPEPSCAGTGTLTYILVEQLTAGLDPFAVYEWNITPEIESWNAKYPECANGSCVLELHRVDAATGARVACFDNPDACLNWFEDPQRATNYQCTYGVHDVDLSECNVYSPTFNRTDAQQGIDYGDPLTGTKAPAVTNPVIPGVGTGGGSAAQCGSAPAFELSIGGIGYWIAHGTLWSLCKAFVPSKPWPNLAEKSPVTEVRSAATALRSLDDVQAGRCVNLGFDMPFGWGRVDVLNSCGNDPFMAWLRGNRGLLSGALWVSFAIGLVWWAWRTYAPGAKGDA